MNKILIRTCIMSVFSMSLVIPTSMALAYNGEPRSPVNQGIDIENETVVSHTNIYNSLLASISSHNTLGSGAKVLLNPYGTAPLSAYLGVYHLGEETQVSVSVTSDSEHNPVTIEESFTLLHGRNLIPVIGLSPAKTNSIDITEQGPGAIEFNYVYEITTDELPPSDSVVDNGKYTVYGTPVFTTMYSNSDFSQRSDGLYISSYFGRGHYALDNNGDVRWMLKGDLIPSFNFSVLPNGRYLSDGHANADAPSSVPEDYKSLYEWDPMGRVYTVYDIDFKAHHSSELIDATNHLIYASENSQPGEGYESTREDGVAILDLTTGQELNYYDMSLVLDPTREHPLTNSDGDPRNDWAHLNKTYLDDSGIIISSVRHQNVMFGIHPNDDTQSDPDIKFILGSHFNWGEKWQPYLLEPVDSKGDPLYDLDDADDQKLADKEFWTWGQHGVIPLPSTSDNIINLAVFDNGNYRSYGDLQYGEGGDDEMLLPQDNWSRYVEYSINLTNMTVEKTNEYGKDSLGPYYYSSLVGNVEQDPDNGNILVNFGGAILDERGLPSTIGVNSDKQDPSGCVDLENDLSCSATGHPSIVELKQETDGSFTKLFELEVTSGRTKTPEDGANGAYRYDITQFFVVKKRLFD